MIIGKEYTKHLDASFFYGQNIRFLTPVLFTSVLLILMSFLPGPDNMNSGAFIFTSTQNGLRSDYSEDNSEIPLIITTQNSELPSNTVNIIYIDSSNSAWIGTDAGLSRLTDDGWMHYPKGNFVMSNQINDIDYERTMYGKEVWVATDSGLTVAAFTDIDGITGATTYFPGNSGIIGFEVNCVHVDPEHNRWIGTDSAIVVFKGSTWTTKLEAEDGDGVEFELSDYTITDLDWIETGPNILITTDGMGILRMNYNDVDGITGASTYGYPWGGNSSDNVLSVSVKGETQWYGMDIGADKHVGVKTKEGWDYYNTDSGLVANQVRETYIDSDTNIWFGTTSGLSILTNEGWYKYTTEEGLVNPQINTITEDYDGFIWVGTNGGIERFSDIPGVLIEEEVSIPSSQEIKTQKLSCYPNPAKDFVHISIKSVTDQEEATIQILDLSGVKHFETLVDAGSELQDISIDLNANKINSGIWIVKFTQGKHSGSKILVVK